MRFRTSNDKIAILSYFAGMILAGSLLLMLPAAWQGAKPLLYIDALFTATSAVCVTGLVVVDTALYSRFGQTVIALLIQFGGLGLIAFATIYIALPRRRISLVNRAIIKDYYIDEVEFEPKRMVGNILASTFAIEAVGAGLLYLRFHDLPDGAFVAVFHAISAFCNAGFSTFPDNLEGYVADPLVNLPVIALIVAGGIGFVVLRDLSMRLKGRKRRLSYHSRVALAVTGILIVLAAAIFFALEASNAYASLPGFQKALAALFQAVTPRTAGFDTVPQDRLSGSSILVTILLMFIGASPASTGGGIKTTTFFILALAALRGADEDGSVVIGRRALPAKSIVKAIGILGKAIVLVLASILAVLVAERVRVASGEIGLVQVIFESVSAFATVGLSLGITPSLTHAAKLILVLTMFAGRIGLFAMSLPLRSRRLDRYVDFPTANVLIG
ncbi:MAG: TrkH family potassium uptake protein [Spirochaetaceae bacterium]|nr:TrkH family potassium uptake protein [Spirochaetaceae bacterium]